MKKKKLQEKIYYAHSKLIYGTKRESSELKWLKKKFHGVVEPNGNLGELGDMEPYLKIVSGCNRIVCSEYDKHIGRGVFFEIEEALAKPMPVYCLRKRLGIFVLHLVKDVKLIDSTDWKRRYGKVILKKRRINGNN